MIDGFEFIYDKASRPMLSQSEEWILKALGTTLEGALHLAKSGRITCVTKYGRPKDGETWCLDGRPFLWMGPLEIQQSLPGEDGTNIHKVGLTRQMRILP